MLSKTHKKLVKENPNLPELVPPLYKRTKKGQLRQVKWAKDILPINNVEIPKNKKKYFSKVINNNVPHQFSHMTYTIKEDTTFFDVGHLDETKDLLRKVIDIQSRKGLLHNRALILILTYRTENGGYFKVKFSKDEVNINHIITTLKHKMTNGVYGDSGDSAELVQVDIKSYQLPTQGGCSNREYTSQSKFKDAKIVSPKSTNNNCLFMCFNRVLGLTGNKVKVDSIRKKLNLELNTKVSIDSIESICEYYDNFFEDFSQRKITVSFVLFNAVYQTIKEKDNAIDGKNNVVVELFLNENEHYCYLVRVNNKKIHCKMCKRQLKVDNEKHRCDPNRIKFMNRHLQLNKTKIVEPRYIKRKTKLDYVSEVITYRTTNEFVKGVLVPVKIDWFNKVHKTSKNIDDFISEITSLTEPKYIVSYGGSEIDFNFLVSQFNKQKVEINNIIRKDTDIITMTVNNCKFIDLKLFIDVEYSKALNDFNCNNLQELFTIFNDIIYEKENANITEFVSLSDSTYSFWTRTVREPIEIFNDTTKFIFVKQGNYGARCYPMKREFKSKNYEQIVSGKLGYEQILDYLIYLDASSLYSASSVDREFPVGISEWRQDSENQFKQNKIGFYKIRFSPPKNLRVPILPRHKQDGGLEWSLYDGEGVYTSVDIKSALKHNYKITFIGDCLVWEKTSSLLYNEYVNKWYETKSKCSGSLQKVAKLLLNGLTGKMNQKPITSETKFINSYEEFIEYIQDCDDLDFTNLSNEYPLLVEVNNKKLEADNIKKPNHLGAFIYAYSRSIMLNFMEAIDPTLTTCMYLYQDTDSMLVDAKSYDILYCKGLICDKENPKLGFLCNDLHKKDCPYPKVIYSKFLAPKTGRVEYIDKNNVMYLKDNGKLLAKAIPKKDSLTGETKLISELYDKDHVEIKFNSFKKKDFTISQVERKRNFNDNYTGMTLVNNDYYPKGYIFDKFS